jgi:hypothetical protein
MPWADQAVADQTPLSERPAIVGTDIVNTVELAVNLDDNDKPIAYLKQLFPGIREGLGLGNFDELRHSTLAFNGR